MLESDDPTSYGSIPIARARVMAEPFARKAIALDPNLGDAYAALGFLSLNLDATAEPYLRKAVQLSPQRPEFHRWHAQTLAALGRYDDAIAEFKRAVEIDPLWGLNYDHLIGALYSVGRAAEARQYARRFFELSTDQRAKLLLLQSLQKADQNLAGQLKTAIALQHAYPDERQMRLNLASALSALGDNRAAAKLVTNDHLGAAVLTSNWPALAQAVEASGPAYWDQYDYWNQAALLIDSGHADTLVKLYDEAEPLIASGRLTPDKVAQPEAIVALRKVGRRADAERLLGQLRRKEDRLPNVGLFGEEKQFSAATVAALIGDSRTALRLLDQWSRRKPFRMTPIPAMALRYDPVFGWLASDPRFPAIEDRLRLAINGERVKAGLPPLSREAWIGDPQTLLTKN
jgi:tetratricopeptide (TPR) repeat protein